MPFVQHFQLVFVGQRHLKIFLFRKGEHTLFEHALHLFVVAAQEVYHLFYLRLVLLACHLSRAGREASAEVRVEAGTRGF